MSRLVRWRNTTIFALLPFHAVGDFFSRFSRLCLFDLQQRATKQQARRGKWPLPVLHSAHTLPMLDSAAEPLKIRWCRWHGRNGWWIEIVSIESETSPFLTTKKSFIILPTEKVEVSRTIKVSISAEAKVVEHTSDRSLLSIMKVKLVAARSYNQHNIHLRTNFASIVSILPFFSSPLVLRARNH